jgi:hypothetical protein
MLAFDVVPRGRGQLVEHRWLTGAASVTTSAGLILNVANARWKNRSAS